MAGIGMSIARARPYQTLTETAFNVAEGEALVEISLARDSMCVRELVGFSRPGAILEQTHTYGNLECPLPLDLHGLQYDLGNRGTSKGQSRSML